MIKILNWLKICLKSQQRQPNAVFSDFHPFKKTPGIQPLSATSAMQPNSSASLAHVQDFTDRQVRSPEVQAT